MGPTPKAGDRFICSNDGETYRGSVKKRIAEGKYTLQFDGREASDTVYTLSDIDHFRVVASNSVSPPSPVQHDDPDEQNTSFKAGEKIEAAYRRSGITKWYPGKIDRVNEDGTYNIMWDDGNCSQNWVADRIRRKANVVPDEQKSNDEQEINKINFTDELPEAPECVVCMNKPSTHICVPCGHKCLCDGSGEMPCHDYAGAKCPKCRTDISAIIKVFD